MHPVDIDQRVEAFLASYATQLQELSEEAFAAAIEGYRSSRLAPFLTYEDLAEDLFDEVANGTYSWNRKPEDAARALQVTKKDLVDMYTDYIAPGGVHRRRVASAVVGADARKDKPTLPAVGREGVFALTRCSRRAPLCGRHR
mmetsp:Transcript_61982/g.146785  ORF Transcript_61982/g.146785 Transcript_61982/m.146785 type:complete len:143 (+) Transcript_61982:142-570(+)